MSHTLDLLADTGLHGTVDGYRAGCTGGVCPSEVSCTEVYIRYAGDWGFRKRVNAGEHPAALILAERAGAEAVRIRDKAAARADRKAATVKAREVEDRKQGRSTLAGSRGAAKATGQKPKRARRKTAGDLHGDRIRALHSEGMSDGAIAAVVGIPSTTVQYVRTKVLHLPANRQARAGSLAGDRAEQIRALHAQGLTDQQIAAELGTTRSASRKAREKLHLSINPDVRGRGPSRHLDDVARLHAEGLTDQEVGDRLGIVKQYAAKLRRDLHLPANSRVRSTPPRAPKPRVLQPHGTNACWARGCRRPECVEAHRQYHRDYVAARRLEGAREYHGTAYGYQLGCRGTGCPSTPSCTQAMLDADRARRRAAGIPAKELVDAKPMRAHVADLVHAGMTIPQVADAAGLPVTVLRKMIHRRGAGRGLVETALAERVAAVLAVRIPEVSR